MTTADRIWELMLARGFKPRQIRGVLATICGITYSAVSQWFDTQTKKISSEYLAKIAAKYGTTVDWLVSGKEPRDVKLLGVQEESVEYNTTEGPAVRGRIPVISWVQAGDFCEAEDLFYPGDADYFVPFAGESSEYTYALRVRGPSMEPRFREDEIIVVDPRAHADPGRFVIAKKTGSNEATFKQLVREGEDVHLRALNPNWPEPIIRLTEEWHICGVVIAKMELF